MRYDRSRIVALIFVVMSVGSAIYVSTATLNYLKLFPALDQIQFQVDRLSFNQSSLSAHVSVSNPTDYSGLRIHQLSVVISFFIQTNTSVTLFAPPNALSASEQISATLGPNSMYSTNVPVGLAPQSASMLTAFDNQHPGQVVGDVQFRVDIVTFLESVTGSVPFTQTLDIPLLSS